jgi:pilus assembly protein Flp/PilA
MKSLLISLHKDENGQDLVEYALVTAIISFGAVTALTSVASGISTAINNITEAFGVGIW